MKLGTLWNAPQLYNTSCVKHMKHLYKLLYIIITSLLILYWKLSTDCINLNTTTTTYEGVMKLVPGWYNNNKYN